MLLRASAKEVTHTFVDGASAKQRNCGPWSVRMRSIRSGGWPRQKPLSRRECAQGCRKAQGESCCARVSPTGPPSLAFASARHYFHVPVALQNPFEKCTELCLRTVVAGYWGVTLLGRSLSRERRRRGLPSDAHMMTSGVMLRRLQIASLPPQSENCRESMETPHQLPPQTFPTLLLQNPSRDLWDVR
jgi:hypothetical protein